MFYFLALNSGNAFTLWMNNEYWELRKGIKLLQQYYLNRVLILFSLFFRSFCPGISRDRVSRVCKYFAEHQEPRPENRGGRRHADVDKDKNKRKAVREHIQTLRCRSSHHSRKDSPGREYLPHALSVAKMHQLFKEQNHVQISYALNYSVFVSNFNLGFGSPAADVCATCVQFRSQVRNESLSDEDKKILTAEFILHRRRQRQFYNLMNDVKDTTAV